MAAEGTRGDMATYFKTRKMGSCGDNQHLGQPVIPECLLPLAVKGSAGYEAEGREIVVWSSKGFFGVTKAPLELRRLEVPKRKG